MVSLSPDKLGNFRSITALPATSSKVAVPDVLELPTALILIIVCFGSSAGFGLTFVTILDAANTTTRAAAAKNNIFLVITVYYANNFFLRCQFKIVLISCTRDEINIAFVMHGFVRKIGIFTLFALFIAIFFTIIFTVKAAQINGYEAESATLQGPVSVGSDNSASGGKYIVFSPSGTSIATPIGSTPPTPLATPNSTPAPTQPPSTGDPVIAAAGDIACGVGSTGAACKQVATAAIISAINPVAVLPLGDDQYEAGALSDFQNYYNPSWGKFKSITYPSVGNHEYLTTGASGYFDYFNGVGNSTGPAGDRSKGYYAFNVDTWRFYALNSNCSSAGGCQAGSSQETWLRADLKSNPHQCVIAYFHHPLYTSGSRATPAVAPLYQALYDNNAELILNGHEHNYERFAPQDAKGNLDAAKGVREFVVGTGGRNFTQFVSNAKNSEIKNDATFGVLKLVLHPSSYDFTFIPIAGSSFTDQGTGACH